MARAPMAVSAQPETSELRADSDVRRVVARELHDRVAQTLTGMLIEVENFKTEQVGWDDVVRQLDTIQDNTRQVLQSLRQLLYELRGEEAATFKFVDSLRSLASHFQAKSGIATRVVVPADWPSSIVAPSAVNIFRIVEEALVNVERHSGATAVAIALEVAPNASLGVSVADNGRGFDLDFRRAGLGTRGMKERAVLLGGDLAIDSGPGTGTTVRINFPSERVGVPAEWSGRITEPRLKPEEIPA